MSSYLRLNQPKDKAQNVLESHVLQSLRQQGLNLSLDQLVQGIDILPWAVHLRDIQTDQYVLANLPSAQHQGLDRVEDFLQLTTQGLQEHRMQRINQLQASLELEADYQSLLEQKQQEALVSLMPLNFTTHNLDYSGWVRRDRVYLFPLQGNPIGRLLLTVTEDMTYRMDLWDLYALYQKHYFKAKGVFHLLRYFNLDQYFPNLPANREMMVLLAMREQTSSKFIACKLGIHARTAEEYKARLKDKLYGVSLEEVVLKLRNFAIDPGTMN